MREMAGLAAWIAACADEDEAVALAAGRGPGKHWDATDGGKGQGRECDGILWDRDHASAIGFLDAHLDCARHAARHDPARALREVAFKRAILTLRADSRALLDGLNGRLARQGFLPDALARDHADLYREMAVLDKAVHEMAEVYSDRPGYGQFAK